MNKTLKNLCFVLMVAVTACGPAPEETSETEVQEQEVKVNSRHPEWAKSANIYEVNVRQYSKEGTFSAFAQHLPRLKEMGVDILWFMPIQPIGELNRKENSEDLGSFYSIQNYTAVNPDLGTLEEFKSLVKEAQGLGMHVLLDWVANHSAWDHSWVSEHPEWYTANANGERPIVPIDNEGNPTNWTDVVDLNYDNTDMRKAMIADMKFWLEETGIDGFRCDVAGFVPDDFWSEATAELSEAKADIFMLAEWEDATHMRWFNMNYGWHLHHIMNQISKGEVKADHLSTYAVEMDTLYGPDDIRMFFTTNHDENSWNGTIEERMGETGLTHFVLASTFGNSMPLIYSGQEMGLNKRLSFFGKDEILWKNRTLIPFYTKTLALKHENPALWNGNYGGPMQVIQVDNEDVFAYYRESGDNRVVVFLNFSDTEQQVPYHCEAEWSGTFRDWYNETEMTNLESSGELVLEPNSFRVYVQNSQNKNLPS